VLLGLMPFKFGSDVSALRTQAFRFTKSRLKPLRHPPTREWYLRDGQHESRLSILKGTGKNAARLATGHSVAHSPTILSRLRHRVLRVAPCNATHLLRRYPCVFSSNDRVHTSLEISRFEIVAGPVPF
jgi:hypothetical protein